MLAEVQLRWSDLDAQAHVNNALIVDYLQEARVQLMQSSGLLDQGVVITGHQVQFHKPVHYSAEPLIVELGVTKMGPARLEVGYELHQAEQLVAQARTQLVPFDFAAQRVRRISPELRDYFDAYRLDWPAFEPLEGKDLQGQGIKTLHYPRWSDLDRYGHVNNMLVFEYLQQARITVAPQWDPTMARTGDIDTNRNWLVVRQDVDYLAQIHHDIAPLQVYTAPVRIGRTSLTSIGEIFSPTGELLARGRSVVVCADAQLHPVPIGDSPVRDFLV